MPKKSLPSIWDIFLGGRSGTLKAPAPNFPEAYFSLVQFKIEKFLLEAPFMVIYMTDFPGFCEKVEQNTNIPHSIYCLRFDNYSIGSFA